VTGLLTSPATDPWPRQASVFRALPMLRSWPTWS